MSLGKLLATGKSIVGGHDMERYRVNSRVFLPKFISPRNPFVQTPDRGSSATTTNSETPASNLPKQEAVAGAGVAAPTLVSRGTRVSVWSAIWNGFKACAGKLNPINLFSRRAPQVKSAIPRFDKKPVQAELSLERVKVMRNDLAEADLEVVPANAARNANKNLPVDGAWGRLTDRVFGPEAT